MEHPEKRIAEIASRMAILSEELKTLNKDLFLSGHTPHPLSKEGADMRKYRQLQFMRYSLSQLTTEVDRLKQVF